MVLVGTYSPAASFTYVSMKLVRTEGQSASSAATTTPAQRPRRAAPAGANRAEARQRQPQARYGGLLLYK